MFKNKWLQKKILLAPIGALIIFMTCSISSAESKVTLRLSWIKDIMTGGPVIAEQKGYFKQNGLDVEILPGGFELDPVKLVAAGSDVFGIAESDRLITARSKGIPIVAIGVEYQKSPIVLISKKEANIKKPKDLIGKKVGVKFATGAEISYSMMLKIAGVDRNSIKEIPLNWDPTPFFTGQIDVLPGYSINEPRIAIRKGVDINIMRAEDFGVNTYGNVYFTHEKTIRENPELVKNFLAAVIDGWWYVFRHKNESIQACLQANDKLDANDQSEIYDQMLPLFVPKNGRFCWMTQDRWKETHDLLLKIGQIKTPLDLNKVYTMDFLNAVYQ